MDDASAVLGRRVSAIVEASQSLISEDGTRFVASCAELICDALSRDIPVLLCGNGGSASDATHLAGELVGRFQLERAPWPALSLSDNIAALSAVANDYGYGEAFVRQVHAFGRPGGVLIALSTSGRSANVLAAVNAARERGLTTVGMTGAGGSELSSACDLCLTVPSTDTACVQEVHMVAGHAVCELVEQTLTGQ